MATQAATATRPAIFTGEPGFFVKMALACTAVVLVGFGLNVGRISYADFHWTVYLHGLFFIAWCALAVVQPALIATRQRSLHRTLGWTGAVLALVMTVSGIATTVAAISAGRFAPYPLFLMLNIATMACFVALVATAIRVRRNTDWHRRLLTCATIIMTGPAWARILSPVAWLGPYFLFALTGVVLCFATVGMIHDWRARRRVHPAWYWGALAIALPGLVAPLGMMPLFADWVATFTPPG